jgi:hypothetical protein
MRNTTQQAGRVTAFAVRTEDAAWIERNAQISVGEDGLVWVYVPAAEVERFERMGRTWLRHTFTDVPADALNATISCPAAWVER